MFPQAGESAMRCSQLERLLQGEAPAADVRLWIVKADASANALPHPG